MKTYCLMSNIIQTIQIAQNTLKDTNNKVKIKEFINSFRDNVLPLLEPFPYESCKNYDLPFEGEDLAKARKVLSENQSLKYMKFFIHSDEYFQQKMKKIKEKYKLEFKQDKQKEKNCSEDPDFDYYSSNFKDISNDFEMKFSKFNPLEIHKSSGYSIQSDDEFIDDSSSFDDEEEDDLDAKYGEAINPPNQQPKKTKQNKTKKKVKKNQKLEFLELDPETIKDLSEPEFIGITKILMSLKFVSKQKSIEKLIEFMKHILKYFENKIRISINRRLRLEREKEEEYNSLISDYYKKFKIIGVTASYAANFRSALERACFNFCIFEEAGELRDSQTMSCILSTFEHVVLFGDPDQLSPVVEFRTKEKINPNLSCDVSCYARLIRSIQNKRCNQLLKNITIERRFVSEISNFLKNIFHVNITTHHSTEKLKEDDIYKVLPYKVNFIMNNEFTESEKTLSHSVMDDKECKFIVEIFLFLIHHQIPPHQITILSFYAAQRDLILKELQNSYNQIRASRPPNSFNPFDLDDFKVSDFKVDVIDNYQGEENNVIIVGTTRSKKIGFVKDKNRAYVALSRAKQLLIVLGNEKLLKEEKSEIWSDIFEYLHTHKDHLKDQGIAYDKGLVIHCNQEKNNPKEIVLTSEDLIEKYRLGCPDHFDNILLECGHPGKLYCGQCKPLPCFQECGHKMKCGHECHGICFKCHQDGYHRKCEELVKFVCERCNRESDKKCYEVRHNIAQCLLPCDEHLIGCGHPCKKPCCHNDDIRDKEHDCGKTMEKECEVCQRKYEIKCIDKSIAKCPHKCDLIMSCGHKCIKLCHPEPECECDKECDFKWPCGHKCVFKCSDKRKEHQHLRCPTCNQKKIKLEKNSIVQIVKSNQRENIL